MGPQALRLPATLDTECASVDQLGQATPEAFAQHPDYQIITSFTGLGDTTGPPACSPRSATTAPASLTVRAQGPRRLRPRRQGVGAEPVDHPPASEQRPPRRRWLRLRIRRRRTFTRSQRHLLPPPRARRPTCRRPAQRVQPAHRLPLPLPAHRPDIRRNHGVPNTVSSARIRCRLTVSKIGGLPMRGRTVILSLLPVALPGDFRR